MAALFFRGIPGELKIGLRLNPLLVGPTGVGKSHLVAAAATAVGARYLRCTRGEWLAVGTDQGRPTVWQILDCLRRHERLCLHLDELDKFTDLQQSGWSAAIASDLWNLLDGRLNLTAYLNKLEADGQPLVSETWLEQRLRRSLWIVGSGTWQEVFRRRSGTVLGFQRSDPAVVDGVDIAHAEHISPELLHRFNTDLLILDYPDPAETVRLLETTGITALARQLAVTLDPAAIDWTQGGLRQLETLATRLCLEFQRRQPNQIAKPAPHRADLQTWCDHLDLDDHVAIGGKP